MSSARPQAVQITEEYYDSSEADAFYQNVWGGEDIHIGLYETPNEDIATASRRTVATMANRIEGISAESRVIDLGSGYGGSARYLASTYGCRVDCLNLSQTQNALNEAKNKEQGLSDLISVTHGSFEMVPSNPTTYDLVWSQDAILHSADRAQVLDEILRILKPGGDVIFTDPMQADNCPDGVLQPILDRIHLENLSSLEFYRDEFKKRGFKEMSVSPLLDHMRTHYARVGEDLNARYEEIIALSGKEYVDNMLRGLGHWVDGSDAGHLAWGIMHFQKEG